jgi:alpha/beta superfamily hydrolase
MHNNVVVATVLYFQNLGITTLRFNFQGSQIGRGYAQVTQVEEAAQFLLDGKHLTEPSSSTPPSCILLVGYSYGSLITASASATIPKCIGCISIAPPISVQHWLLCFNGSHHTTQARKRTTLPRLFVIGSRDNFTLEEKFLEHVTSFPQETTTGAVLKGADHFFNRREKDLMSIVGQWLISTYPACGGNISKLKEMEFHSFINTNVTVTPTAGQETSGSFFGCV